MPGEFIGVAALRPHMANLRFPKKELFVFDKVVLLELRSLMGDMRASGLDFRLRQADELEWLLNAGLIVEHDFTKHTRTEEVERELAALRPNNSASSRR